MNYEVFGKVDVKIVVFMVFIFFIENVFKYIGNKKNSKVVDIGVKIEEDVIIFSC